MTIFLIIILAIDCVLTFWKIRQSIKETTEMKRENDLREKRQRQATRLLKSFFEKAQVLEVKCDPETYREVMKKEFIDHIAPKN